MMDFGRRLRRLGSRRSSTASILQKSRRNSWRDRSSGGHAAGTRRCCLFSIYTCRRLLDLPLIADTRPNCGSLTTSWSPNWVSLLKKRLQIKRRWKTGGRRGAYWPRRCETMIKICIVNEEFCIKHEELCIENEEFCNSKWWILQISAQEEIVSELRFRVEAEDQLLEVMTLH